MSESLHRRVCHAVRGEIARYAYGAHVHIDMFHGCVFCGVISRSKRCSPTEALVREETPLSALWRSQEERGVTEANQRFVAANRRQSWATDIAKARQDGLEAGVTV